MASIIFSRSHNHGTEHNIYVTDYNVSFNEPDGLELESYEVNDIEKARFSHQSKYNQNQQFFNKNTVVKFENAEVMNLEVEDCESAIKFDMRNYIDQQMFSRANIS